MSYEIESRGKKMHMNKNIARLAVTAGLTAALSFGGVMAPVTMAFAAGGQGSITINKVAGNENTTFKAYQIFKATVTDTTTGKTAQDITWASSDLGTKVTNAIKNDWAGYKSLTKDKQLPENPTAQEVADFLMAHADNPTASSADGKNKGTRVTTGNVLYAVADAVKNETSVKSGIVADTTWIPDPANGNGYYLFVTDESSLGTDKKNTGTSPIFALVGGEAVTVTEKTSIPTVDKQIVAATSDDPTKLTDGWAGVADSQIGQEVTYKLTGKVADNYATYDSYAYKFTDTLSAGLDYVADSLQVYAVNNGAYTLIDGGYEVTPPNESSRVLTVNFAVDKDNNKKGLKDVQGVDADTQIVVFYRAKLNKNAVTGNGDSEGKKGNYNTVKLEYSNNPSTEGTGTSVESGAGDFTFKLNLNKVDQGTEKGLEGAEFSIQSADADTLNQYVASKNSPDGKVVAGQLVNFSDKDLPDYLKFSSDDKGKIEVKGLDAGSYKVTEIKAPNDKYTVANPFTFTIKAEYKDNAAELEKITVSPSQNDKLRSDVALGTLDGTPGDNTLTVTNNTAANVQTGEVNITIGNTKQVGLPLTGLNGVTFTWIAGGAVLCIGVAHLIRSRKQAEESEQE